MLLNNGAEFWVSILCIKKRKKVGEREDLAANKKNKTKPKNEKS